MGSHRVDTTQWLSQHSNLWDVCGSAGKESTCNAGDLGSIPGLGRSPGEGNGYPLQYPGLENSMDCIVHRVAKRWTCLSDFHFHNPLLLDSTCGKWGSIREVGYERTPKMSLEDSPISLKPHIMVSVTVVVSDWLWWEVLGVFLILWAPVFFSTCVTDRPCVLPSLDPCSLRAVKLLRLEVGSFGHKVALFFFHFWFRTLNSGQTLPVIFIQ